MWSSKLSSFAVIFFLATTSCSSCDIFFERPDYNLCSNSSGSAWEESGPGEFLRFKRRLPTQTNGCLVYNSEMKIDLIGTSVDGTICNACDSVIEIPLATFRGEPIIQSTLRLENNDYATCLSSGGEQVKLKVVPIVKAIQSGDAIPALGSFLYWGGFTTLNDNSLARGKEFQVFWPSLGSGEIVLEGLETGCLGSFELNDSLFVQVVDEPFSDPVRNFLEDKILRRD